MHNVQNQAQTNDWFPEQDVPEKRKQNILQWWFNLTSIPDPPIAASHLKREEIRRSRLVSIIGFCLLVIFVICSPASLTGGIAAKISISAIFPVVFISMLLNRSHKIFLAGLVIVLAIEIIIPVRIYMTQPFTENDIQVYGLLIFGELFAVTLLPARSVFFVAIYNSIFIPVSLFYLPKNQILTYDVHTHFATLVAYPIAVQFTVAAVTYIAAVSTLRAIARADRAEVIAALERQIAQQKNELELGIQKIIQTHISVANGNLNARAPLTQDNVLWHVANSLNTLLTRFQRASLAQENLQHLTNAIAYTTAAVQQTSQQMPLQPLPATNTAIDPLLLSLNVLMLSINQKLAIQQQRQSGRYNPNAPYNQNSK